MRKAKFAVGTKVKVSYMHRSAASDKTGEVREVRVHPYGESYGYVYLIPGVGVDQANVWLPESRLAKVR